MTVKSVAFKPVDLRVDFAGGAMPVTENTNPVFSWAAVHSGKNQKQTGYRITAERNGCVIWDSGYVESGEQAAVYSGEPLQNNDLIKWRLVLTDKDGVDSIAAEQSFAVSFGKCFDTTWIAPSDYEQRDVNYFKKSFSVTKQVKRAVLSVCGLGFHEVYFNGNRLDEGYFQPVFANYDKLMYYCVLQISGECFSEMNSIGIVLADGWRNNKGDWSVQMLKNHPVPMFGDQVLGARLDIYYSDGTCEAVTTDDSWSVIKTPARSHLFAGEQYDETYTSREKRAILTQKPNGILRPQTCPPEKLQERYKPVSAVSCADGFLVDFGVNIAGFCEVKIPASINDGRKIILRHSERIDDDYELYTESMRSARSVDTYITKCGKREDVIWHPHFTYHGFRYVHISGLDFVDNDTITAVAVYSDINKESSFVCSDMVINRIQQAIVQTEKCNIHGLFTDCPQRDERMGWMNDATVRFEQVPYNFDAVKMFEKVVADCACEQDALGRISCTAPYFFGCIPADPVCSAFMVAAMENLMHYGDRRTVKKYYDSFKAWNEFLKSQSSGWIVEYSHYGDWAGPAEACASLENPHSAVTPDLLMSTGYFYYNYKLLERFAAVCGYDDEIIYNRECAECVKQAILDKWVDENATVAGGSQGAQAFALWLGILPKELCGKAAGLLNAKVIENNYRITTGNLTTKRVLEMLCEYGYENTAFEVISRDEYPSIGYMLRRGATTIWERFEDKKNSQMNSHNHPMYGALGSWFYEYIAGIKPTKPAFDEVQIKPYFPEKLEFAKVVLDTSKGKILVEWKRSEGKVNLYVDIPFGVAAKVYAGSVHKVGSGFYKFIIGE